MTPLAAYLLLFVAVGAGFILVNLLAGLLFRPNRPDAEKGTIYECGEPTIGTAWVQFDLRYYVVALLFVIFDVEVAFFFPWAEVFGKANAVANLPEPSDAAGLKQAAEVVLDLATRPDVSADVRRRVEGLARLSPEAAAALDELMAQDREARAAKPPRASTLGQLRDIPAPQLAPLKGMPTTGFDTLRAEAGRLAPILKKVAEGREAVLARLKAALEPPVSTQPWAQSFRSESEEALQGLSLGQLAALPQVGAMDQVSQAETVRARLLKVAPAALKAADAEADPLRAEMAREAKASMAAIEKVLPAGKGQAAAGLTWQTLTILGGLPDGVRVAVAGGQITPEVLVAVKTMNTAAAGAEATEGNAMLHKARTEARELAWLALAEVLIFFGVLLVGFAYLWRRGDIEWVRSTAAERPAAADKPQTGA